jgi:glycosyltransferase involved in cell wall biosynthesis
MEYTPLASPVRIIDQQWPVETIPLVSICCVTYNHEAFIGEAIEGFLMQETTFPVKIIIHDDASCDGTSDIIRDYQRRYPDLIRAIIQSENQHSKGGLNLIAILAESFGKYAALCEGDDYWICKYKLQKQVDLMQSNKNFAISFHDAFSEEYSETKGPSERKPLYQNPPADILKFEDFASGFAPPTASCLILNRKNVFDWLIKHRLGFAKQIFYALTEGGEVAAFIPEKMSVYRIHQGGIFSCIPLEKQLLMSNSGLWNNRKAFPSRNHKSQFSLKLLDNYVILLSIYLRERDGLKALLSILKIMQLLAVPPSTLIIRTFTLRLLTYLQKYFKK